MHLFNVLKCTLFNYLQELRSIERQTEAGTYPRLIRSTMIHVDKGRDQNSGMLFVFTTSPRKKILNKTSEIPDTPRALTGFFLYKLLCHMSNSAEMKSPHWINKMKWIQNLYIDRTDESDIFFYCNNIYHIYRYHKSTKFCLKRDNRICKSALRKRNWKREM